jgi:DNA-binding XRE family transcriptional regulator
MSTVLKFNITISDAANADKFINTLKGMGLTPEIETDNAELVSLDDAIQSAFPDKTPEEVTGMILRDVRNEKGVTQSKLAEILKTSRTAISAMESGKRPISKAMAKKLGSIFDVAYTAFL